jgi:hypothetical protein
MTGPLIPRVFPNRQQDEVCRMRAHDDATRKFFEKRHAARLAKRAQRAARRLRKHKSVQH